MDEIDKLLTNFTKESSPCKSSFSILTNRTTRAIKIFHIKVLQTYSGAYSKISMIFGKCMNKRFFPTLHCLRYCLRHRLKFGIVSINEVHVPVIRVDIRTPRGVIGTIHLLKLYN